MKDEHGECLRLILAASRAPGAPTAVHVLRGFGMDGMPWSLKEAGLVKIFRRPSDQSLDVAVTVEGVALLNALRSQGSAPR